MSIAWFYLNWDLGHHFFQHKSNLKNYNPQFSCEELSSQKKDLSASFRPFSCVAANWNQGFMLARQVLYAWASYIPCPVSFSFILSFFFFINDDVKITCPISKARIGEEASHGKFNSLTDFIWYAVFGKTGPNFKSWNFTWKSKCHLYWKTRGSSNTGPAFTKVSHSSCSPGSGPSDSNPSRPPQGPKTARKTGLEEVGEHVPLRIKNAIKGNWGGFLETMEQHIKKKKNLRACL